MRGKGRQQGKAKAKGNAREAAFAALLRVADGGRDIGLGPFHALGKLLYNKRLVSGDGVCAPPLAHMTRLVNKQRESDNVMLAQECDISIEADDQFPPP